MRSCLSSKCLVTARTETNNSKMTCTENGGIVFLQNFVTRPLDRAEDVLELDQSITKCPNQCFTTIVPLNVVRDFITNREKKKKKF